MHQPDKAPAPPQKQAAAHVMISLGQDMLMGAGGGDTSQLLLSRSLQELISWLI